MDFLMEYTVFIIEIFSACVLVNIFVDWFKILLLEDNRNDIQKVEVVNFKR